MHVSKILHTIYTRVIMTVVRNIFKRFRNILKIVFDSVKDMLLYNYRTDNHFIGKENLFQLVTLYC